MSFALSLRRMSQIHLVTFATPAFCVRQWLLNQSARHFGRVDRLHIWTKSRLAKSGFISSNAELFPNSKGFGWYAWKPWVILQALRQANEGDLVIYQDVGRREPVLISRTLENWNDFLTQHGYPCIAGVRIPDWGPNRLWTKKTVFHKLGLLGQQYEDAPQVQASWSLWRKNHNSVAFVNEWASLCQSLTLVGGQLEHGLEGEVPGFHEHRWDQSLLTMLTLRDNIPTLNLSDRRSPLLNDKSIDSYSKLSHSTLGFIPFRLLVSLYYLSERAAKRLTPSRDMS